MRLFVTAAALFVLTACAAPEIATDTVDDDIPVPTPETIIQLEPLVVQAKPVAKSTKLN